MVLVGHSVGAWMALASIMEPDIPAGSSSSVIQMPVLEATIRSAIRTVVLVVCRALTQDGIFDIETLLEEYPDYYGFVSNALRTTHDQPGVYVGVSSRAWKWTKDVLRRTNIVLLHSPQDELLSFIQPCTVLQRLAQLRQPAEATHSVAIPTPAMGVDGPAVWYRGTKQTGKLVSDIYQGAVHNVPSTIQVYWDRLQVCKCIAEQLLTHVATGNARRPPAHGRLSRHSLRHRSSQAYLGKAHQIDKYFDP